MKEKNVIIRIFVYILIAVVAYATGAFLVNHNYQQGQKYFCFTSVGFSGWHFEDVYPEPIFCDPYGYEDEERYYSSEIKVNHFKNETYRPAVRKDSGTMLLLLIDQTLEKIK